MKDFLHKYKFYFYIILFCLSLSSISFSQIKNDENQIRLAKSFEEVNNFEEAEKIYKTLLLSQPQNFNYYRNLHDLFLKTKNYNECQKLIEKQIITSPSNIDLYGDLGSLYYLKGNDKEANKVWEKGIALDSENPFSYRIIANYLFENRLLEQAVDMLKRGNSKSEDNTIFSYDIANIYSLTMKFDKAAEEYCRILESKPNQTAIVKNRILSYVNSTGAEKPTIDVLEEFYKSEENTSILELLIEVYLKTNNFSKVLESAITYDKESLNNGSYLFNIAIRVSRLGDHVNAEKIYKYILENYSQSPLFAQTEINYTREIESNLKSEFSKTESWKKYYNPVYDKNKFKELINSYQNISKKYKNNIGIEADFRTGIIYQEIFNDVKKADSIYLKIAESNFGNEILPEVKYRLARLNIQTGDLSHAENILAETLKYKVNDQKLFYELKFLNAKIKMWSGKFSEAISELNEVKSNSADEYSNDALQLLLLLNTFKKDSLNLLSYINADYLIEKKKFNEAAEEFKKLAGNKNLILLKDFASVNYIELLLTLNNYEEAVIFLNEILNCDEDNIFKDRFLFLLGSTYYYGLKNSIEATKIFSKMLEEFPNSIYTGKSRKIISEINNGVKGNK